MTQRDAREAIVRPGDAGGLVVASPAVGVYGDAPDLGEVLAAGSRAGRLTQLGRTFDLVLPAGASGRVEERAVRHRAAPVQYGEALLRLAPEGAAGERSVVGRGRGARSGLPRGTFAVTSPTHGVFYRRARPDEPPYVAPGDVVEEGATLALVEVMKCFSPIAYRGEGFPPRAEVVEVRAEDGAEVQADQVLLVLRPA